LNTTINLFHVWMAEEDNVQYLSHILIGRVLQVRYDSRKSP